MNLKKVLVSLFSLSLALSPMNICAEESIGTIYAHSQNPNETTRLYRTIEDAWDDACAGSKICLSNDWILSSRLVIPEGKTVTIDMNGYKIDRNLSESVSDGEVIYMSENSSLTIMGSQDSTMSVKNLYKDYDGNVRENITLGGAITGGASQNGGGGIHMKAGSKLTLDHVGVVGNYSQYLTAAGGGIMVDGDGCEINLNNGSMVSYNYSFNAGGGIYVNNENANINMDNSTISYNHAYGDGGGIYSQEDATRIFMSNNSTIDNNLAQNGGGLYFNDSYSSIQSGDSTGVISNNSAKNGSKGVGGAIYYANVELASEEAEIKNITIKNNSAWSLESDSNTKGGAIYTCQDDLTLTNCTLTDNFADNGGAIYADDDLILDGSTIENNKATSKGGGVYVDSLYNVTLRGLVTVQNNTRKNSDKKDDIYLDTGSITHAYVSRTPDAGSKVGLLGIGATLVGIDQTNGWRNIYFLDESDSYHLECYQGSMFEKSGATGSVFGNGNTLIALCVMVGIGVVGTVVLVVKKKKKSA